jgi:hypothetical protein
MIRRALVLGFAAATLAAAASCSSSSASSPDGSDGGAGDAATEAASGFGSGACGSCVVDKCRQAREVCDAEPSCASHASCADKCPASSTGVPDKSCLDACPGGANSVAARARATYDTCLLVTGPKACDGCTKPPADKSVLDVTDQQCGTSTDPNACYKCEEQKCCKTYEGCAAEPECKEQLQPCVKACTDAKCVSNCYAQHPKGVLPWARRLTCMLVNCATECGGAPNDCVKCSSQTICRDTFVRCNADEGCFLLRACLDETCPDVTEECLTKCKAKVPPAAGALFDEWTSCAFLSCPACR